MHKNILSDECSDALFVEGVLAQIADDDGRAEWDHGLSSEPGKEEPQKMLS